MLSTCYKVYVLKFDNLSHILFRTFTRLFGFEKCHSFTDQPYLSTFVNFDLSRQNLFGDTRWVFVSRSVDHLPLSTLESFSLVTHSEIKLLSYHLTICLLTLCAQFVHNSFPSYNTLTRICVATKHGGCFSIGS